jgi:hypothetical protein
MPHPLDSSAKVRIQRCIEMRERSQRLLERAEQTLERAYRLLAAPTYKGRPWLKRESPAAGPQESRAFRFRRSVASEWDGGSLPDAGAARN